MEDEESLEGKVGSPGQGVGGGWQEGVRIVLWLHKMLLKMQVGPVDMTGPSWGTREWRWGWGGRWRSGGTLGKDFVWAETLIAALKATSILLLEILSKEGLFVTPGTLSVLSRASHHWGMMVLEVTMVSVVTGRMVVILGVTGTELRSDQLWNQLRNQVCFLFHF